MPAPISPTLANTFPPPVMEARAWLTATDIPDHRPLLNLSQAAPVDPPPLPLRQEMARHVLETPDTHLYGPVLGLPDLRAEIAKQWSALYRAEIASPSVAVTAGCNQAFCAAIASVASPGDSVILPTPWYFNHKMWLDMAGIGAQLLPCGPDMCPDPDKAAALIGPDTKAIVLVSPNNPTGATYPTGLLERFADLAAAANIALILDETYRDYIPGDGPPHTLFQRPDWGDWFIHLYSFSKVYRLTGHRTGALIASPARLAEIEKFLDTVAICPSQLGQYAALFGLQTMGDWVAAERAEILDRRAALMEAFPTLEGWSLLGCGAYFAFAEHPFAAPSNALAERLLADQSLLLLPGTMFAPVAADGGDGRAERQLRIAFANADRTGIATLISRLQDVTLPRRKP